MLFAAIVLGAALAPVIAFVGLPIAAAGIAGLAYRGRRRARSRRGCGRRCRGRRCSACPTWRSSLRCSRPWCSRSCCFRSGRCRPSAPVLVAVLAAREHGRRRVARAVAGHHAAGHPSRRIADVSRRDDEGDRELGIGRDARVRSRTRLRMIASAWPSAYFQAAVFVGVLVIVAVAWAARRVDRPLESRRSRGWTSRRTCCGSSSPGCCCWLLRTRPSPASSMLGVVGLNLVLCARTLFFLQGFSVVSGGARPGRRRSRRAHPRIGCARRARRAHARGQLHWSTGFLGQLPASAAGWCRRRPSPSQMAGAGRAGELPSGRRSLSGDMKE